MTWQLIDFARMYLRLGELEETTKEGGRLRVHIGDAFGPEVNVEGGFAGENANSKRKGRRVGMLRVVKIRVLGGIL